MDPSLIMNDTFQKRLRKARINLISDMPFFGTLAFKLKTVEDASIPTACVDGIHLRINPDYAATLSGPQLAGLLVEEIGHCAMGHIWRENGREHQLWNQACDQTLWETILKLTPATDGRVALSPDCRWDSRYAGMSAEEIYHAMQQQSKGGGGQQPKPSAASSPGEFQAPPDNSPTDNSPSPSDNGQPTTDNSPSPTDNGQPATDNSSSSSATEQDWKHAVAQAATVERQRGQGSLPAWLKLLVEELVEPKVPWTEYVREFCHRLSRDDYSFRRPNRRLLGSGFVLPSLHSETLGPIVGAFDTSGSISCISTLITDMLGEFQGVLDLCRPEKLLLLDCDTSVHQQQEFFPGDDLRAFVPTGGGGTDFRPVFAAIAALPEPPACLIFLTDLEGCFPREAPPYPVLWANFGEPRSKAPFGTTIFVPLA